MEWIPLTEEKSREKRLEEIIEELIMENMVSSSLLHKIVREGICLPDSMNTTRT
jgi:hypothetical protein